MKIMVFTDGACSGNPGPGGWGAVLFCPDQKEPLMLSGASADTTNNRMELMAALESLRYIKTADLCLPIHITSDSRYLVDGMTKWTKNWVGNQWKTSQKKPVENQDLWKSLLLLESELPPIEWTWVKGHAGHPENTLADDLARQAIKTIS
jgi:ribonuclease HI